MALWGWYGPFLFTVYVWTWREEAHKLSSAQTCQVVGEETRKRENYITLAYNLTFDWMMSSGIARWVEKRQRGGTPRKCKSRWSSGQKRNTTMKCKECCISLQHFAWIREFINDNLIIFKRAGHLPKPTYMVSSNLTLVLDITDVIPHVTFY